MRFNFIKIFFTLLLSVYNHGLLAKELKVEHVANAGVKISSAGKVVLIDAIFGPHNHFNFLNEGDFSQLVQQGADVTLATHIHDDHFSATRTATFLNKNHNALFIGTPKMLERLNGKVMPGQIESSLLTDFESMEYKHNDINISALNFPHMSPHPKQAKNYAYIVEINGWKVLHVGDGNVNAGIIEGQKLADKKIDVALIHDLFPVNQKNYLELIKQMNVGKIVFVHMTDDKAEPLKKWLKENLPNASMLVTGYESIILNKK
jgi:L-ascorbate metabolism protein UlaG (beta-lactamase superfamily)